MSGNAWWARVLGGLVSALCLYLLALHHDSVHAGGAPALCDEPENSYFSCGTGNGRLIELCGGKTVEYRFGKPGRLAALPRQTREATLAAWRAPLSMQPVMNVERPGALERLS